MLFCRSVILLPTTGELFIPGIPGLLKLAEYDFFFFNGLMAQYVTRCKLLARVCLFLLHHALLKLRANPQLN